MYNSSFPASKVAQLLLSRSSALLSIASILFRLVYVVGPVTHAVKSSRKAIAPPWPSICRCTRSALKKRKRIGDRGEPRGSPACGRLWASDTCPLIWMVAVRSEQNASTHLSRTSGIPRAVILWINRSLQTPLYAPLTSKLIKLKTCRPRHAA